MQCNNILRNNNLHLYRVKVANIFWRTPQDTPSHLNSFHSNSAHMVWHINVFSNNIPTNCISSFLAKISKNLRRKCSDRELQNHSNKLLFSLPLKLHFFISEWQAFKISSFTCYWTSGSSWFSLWDTNMADSHWSWTKHKWSRGEMEFFFLTDCPKPTAAKCKYYFNIAFS